MSFEDTLDEEPQMYPEREKETNFEADVVREVYEEYKRKKEDIRQHIESLTREKDFIERLKPDDVIYMLQKERGAKLSKEIEDFDREKLGKTGKDKYKSGAIDYNHLKPDQDEMIRILNEDELDKDQKVKLDKQRFEFK